MGIALTCATDQTADPSGFFRLFRKRLKSVIESSASIMSHLQTATVQTRTLVSGLSEHRRRVERDEEVKQRHLDCPLHSAPGKLLVVGSPESLGPLNGDLDVSGFEPERPWAKQPQSAILRDLQAGNEVIGRHT